MTVARTHNEEGRMRDYDDVWVLMRGFNDYGGPWLDVFDNEQAAVEQMHACIERGDETATVRSEPVSSASWIPDPAGDHAAEAESLREPSTLKRWWLIVRWGITWRLRGLRRRHR